MKLRMIAIALLAAFALVATASAQQATRVNIPFEFVINGKAMPAGTYAIQTEEYSHIFKMQGIDKAAAASVLYIPSGSYAKTPRLVFQNVNGTEVLLSAAPSGELLQMPVSKEKTQVAKKGPGAATNAAGN